MLKSVFYIKNFYDYVLLVMLMTVQASSFSSYTPWYNFNGFPT
jgi:hypothetical protein